MRFHVAATMAALLMGQGAHAAPADALRALLSDHWAAFLKANPVYATTLGERAYDRELGDPSLAEMDRQAAQATGFLKRLDAIDAAALPQGDRVTADVLRRLLREQVEGNRFGQRLINFTTYSGWHQGLAGMGERLPFFTRADYDNYLARLEKVPAYAAAATEVTRASLQGGFAQPCEVLAQTERTITGAIAADPAKSRLYAPFRATRPATIAEVDWRAMQTRAQRLITDRINPAYQRFATFFRTEYLPRCAKAPGVRSQPNGAAYYAFRARAETTTDLTPEQIHALGLSEVARIRAEMEAVAKTAGFTSREAYIQHLRTDPRHYAKTPAELMREAGYTAKIVDGWMPRLFGRLPRLPYTVREIPAETAEGTTTAYYDSGSLTSGQAGTYYLNTSKLDQRPLYELPALTIHEAVPGHHHQISLAQELDLPPVRRYAASFTGFVEGWGLYSERLGIEMGIYDTPAKDMGRLSYEMWRACRLVVDTGIHAKGWSKARAVQFMLDNTALSAANIDAEVNRYISWPGQALAYKIGELKIRELRTRAEARLGAKFDLRAFHDAVLENGAIPLDALEAHMTRWMEAQPK